MKNKVKVTDVFKIKEDKIIFTIELLEGYFNIQDVFKTNDDKLKFSIKGIGMENQTESKNKSLLVSLLGEYKSTDDFKGKIFLKETEE
jgi:hypothetical protein